MNNRAVNGWYASDGELPYSRGLWLDVTRNTEYEAFGLILGILQTGLQLAIFWDRNDARLAREQKRDELYFVELAFKTFRYYLFHAPELTHRGRLEIVAAVLSNEYQRVTADDVANAIVTAEQMGIAEAA